MFLPSIDPSQMVSSKFLASSATSVYGRPSNEQSMGGGKRTKKSHKPKFDRWLPSVRIRLAGSPAVDGWAPSRPPVAPPVHGPPRAPPLALEKEAPNTTHLTSFTRRLASIFKTDPPHCMSPINNAYVTPDHSSASLLISSILVPTPHLPSFDVRPNAVPYLSYHPVIHDSTSPSHRFPLCLPFPDPISAFCLPPSTSATPFVLLLIISQPDTPPTAPPYTIHHTG